MMKVMMMKLHMKKYWKKFTSKVDNKLSGIAQKYPLLYIIIGIVPWAILCSTIGKAIGMNIETIVYIQIILLLFQITGGYLIYRYQKEIFNN
jgi:hypothetical protein